MVSRDVAAPRGILIRPALPQWSSAARPALARRAAGAARSSGGGVARLPWRAPAGDAAFIAEGNALAARRARAATLFGAEEAEPPPAD